MYPLLKRLWQRLNLGFLPTPAPAAAPALSVRWRCINAELGLAAWVAEPADRLALPRQPRGAKLLLAPEGGEGPALARLRQLAALHPDCLIVLPRWQNDQAVRVQGRELPQPRGRASRSAGSATQAASPSSALIQRQRTESSVCATVAAAG